MQVGGQFNEKQWMARCQEHVDAGLTIEVALIQLRVVVVEQNAVARLSPSKNGRHGRRHHHAYKDDQDNGPSQVASWSPWP